MATANLPQGADIIGAVVPRIDGALKTTGNGPLRRGSRLSRISRTRWQCRARSAKDESARWTHPPPRRCRACCWCCTTATWKRVYRTFPHQEDGTISEARPPFEDDKIYYWGQFVAVVVAETLEQAKGAAQAVQS